MKQTRGLVASWFDSNKITTLFILGRFALVSWLLVSLFLLFLIFFGGVTLCIACIFAQGIYYLLLAFTSPSLTFVARLVLEEFIGYNHECSCFFL